MNYENYQDELDLLVAKVEGENDKDWQELVDELGINCHPDSLRKSFNVGKYCGYQVYKYFKNQMNENLSEKEFERLENLKYNLSVERKKQQIVNREINKIARIEARNEMFQELLLEEVKYLEPIQIKNFKYNKSSKSTGVLCISDAHYGENFQLNGLFGEVVNQYSPEEFKNRMWNLLAQLEAQNLDCERLLIMDIGDCISGILRMGSLQKLETGVIQSALEYAEFMSVWLVEAWNRLHIPIEYSLRGGNHDMLRLLTEKKVFEEENIGKVIHQFIKLRVENIKLANSLEANIEPDKIKNIITIADYSDVIYHSIYGMNILSYHGDSKNLKEDIEFFENFYNIDIDIIITGHLHRNSQETIGIGYNGDREIMRVPSIMGGNVYSKRIRKHSRAGCKFILFTEDGKDYEKTFFLN